MTDLNEKDSNLIYDKEYVERLKDKFLSFPFFVYLKVIQTVTICNRLKMAIRQQNAYLCNINKVLFVLGLDDMLSNIADIRNDKVGIRCNKKSGYPHELCEE